MSEAPDRERSTQAEASSAGDLAILSDAAQADDVLLPRKGERRFWRRLGYPRAPQRPFLELFPPAANQAGSAIIAPAPESTVEAGLESAGQAGGESAVSAWPEGPVEGGLESASEAGSPAALAAGFEGAASASPESAGQEAGGESVSASPEGAVEAGLESTSEAGSQGALAAGFESAASASPESAGHEAGGESAASASPEGAVEAGLESAGQAGGESAVSASPEGPIEGGLESASEAGLQSAIEAAFESVVATESQGAVEAEPQAPSEPGLESASEVGAWTAIETGAQSAAEERIIETAPVSVAEAASPAVYHSSTYDRAARELCDAIGRHERLMLLTGEAGSGKTTLCRALMEQMDSRTFTALISGPFTDIEQLLRHVLAAFGLISDVNISGPDSRRHELRVTLRDFLRSLEPLHARAILFVDDAHTLSADLLRRVSSFANIDGDKRLLQVVLVGGPQLRLALSTADLRTVDEQLTARVELKPLTRVEFAEYLAFHAAQTGQAEPLILDVPTLTTQYEAANGLPGLVDGDARRPDVGAIPAPAATGSVVESIVREPEPAAVAPKPVVPAPEPAATAPEPEPEPTERRTSPLTVALLGLVVVLGGLAAWVYGTRAIDFLKVWLG
jgi:type II secretory pathway predicted ATPase ExeA